MTYMYIGTAWSGRVTTSNHHDVHAADLHAPLQRLLDPCSRVSQRRLSFVREGRRRLVAVHQRRHAYYLCSDQSTSLPQFCCTPRKYIYMVHPSQSRLSNCTAVQGQGTYSNTYEPGEGTTTVSAFGTVKHCSRSPSAVHITVSTALLYICVTYKRARLCGGGMWFRRRLVMQ